LSFKIDGSDQFRDVRGKAADYFKHELV